MRTEEAAVPVTHIHIGAGSFGLGMVVERCTEAGLQTVVLSRQRTSKDYHKILRESGKYSVVFEAGPKKVTVPIRYFERDNDEAALQLLSEPAVSLLTTSVKKDNLPAIAPLIAKAINRRSRTDAGPLCVLACENFLQNSAWLKKITEPYLPSGAKRYYRDQVVFSNTVVDRICSRIRCKGDSVEVPFKGNPDRNWRLKSSLAIFPGKKSVRRQLKLENLSHHSSDARATVDTTVALDG